jgi:hypothetical protein
MECANYVRRVNFCTPSFQHVLKIIGLYYWHVLLALRRNVSREWNTEKVKIY